MKMRMRLMMISLMVLGGCSSLVETNQAFLNIPGQTIADHYGRREVLDQIRWLSRASTRKDCVLSVMDTYPVGKELSTVIEHWEVNYCGEKIKYKVRIADLGKGTVRYIVTYPGEAEK